MAHYGQDPATEARGLEESHPMRGRGLARIAVATQAILLAGALILPTVAAAATLGFTLEPPSLSTVAYSDFVVLRGTYTCINDDVSVCPTALQSRSATFSIRPSGGASFTNVGTVATSFSFTSDPGGCPTTCSQPFQLTWKAGRALGTTVPPGVYDVGLTTTASAGQLISLGAVTVVAESTTTTYSGLTSGMGNTDLALSASVVDQDRGQSAGTGIFSPDANLAGSNLVTFELFDTTNTTSVAGPVSAALAGGGLTSGSPKLPLPPSGGTFKLRTTFVGNDFYTTSSDLDAITVTPSNTPPVLTVPASPVIAEATSAAGAAVSYTVSAGDTEDEPDPTPTCTPSSGSVFALGDTTVSCSVTDSGGLSDAGSFVVRVVDTTLPDIAATLSPAPDAGTGWWNASTGAPTVTYACSDSGSGVASCSAPFTFGEGAGQGATGTGVDVAGNSSTASVSGVDVDLTAPLDLAFIGGGLMNGASYALGSVPAGPSGCTATDGLSGLASCQVTGYSSLAGGHVVTATAIDTAGNASSIILSYTVVGWTVRGFGNSISMTSPNVAKGGSVVNLKFEILAGATRLTSLDAVAFILQTPATCATARPLGRPAVASTTRGFGLRVDPGSGQYMVKWDVPSGPGACWIVSVVAADGSSLGALFQVK